MSEDIVQGKASKGAKEERHKRKSREGVVEKNAMDKTVIVRVERKTQHPLYGKTIRKSKKFYAHDEKNEASKGDRVRIVESRPISKLKRWRVAEVLEKGQQ